MTEDASVDIAAPPHWEADVVAADGGTVHLRPITPEDADGIVGLMERSSDQTRYYRFFGPMRRLSDKDLHRFTHVDHDSRVAFVVLLGDRLIPRSRAAAPRCSSSTEPRPRRWCASSMRKATSASSVPG